MLLLKADNGEAVDCLSPIVQSYLKNDIDQERLKIQLSLVHDMIKTVTADVQCRPVTEVTNIRTIAEAMNTSTIY